MELNFIKETQNNKIKTSELTSTLLINTEDQNKINNISQNNNLSNNIQVNEAPKNITNISTNISFPINKTQYINLNSIKNINNKTQIINLKSGNKRYKELVNKIALQLKTRTKTPTEGFFHFALLKGEYSFIIIKKISKQIINHQIEFNNNIFRIYIKKYYKYRELIKRIAHLLKLSMNKRKQIINSIQNEKASNIQNNIKTNIFNNRNLNNGNQVIEYNLNLDNNINNLTNNISQNNIKTQNNDISKGKINEYNDNKEKRTIIKSGDLDKKVNIDNGNTHAHTSIFNQQKTKTQINNSNKLFLNSHNFSNNHYNRNYISDKRINPINPFIASKEKILNHNKNNNFSKKRNKTFSNIQISNNQNSKTINFNINNQHNNIKNTESKTDVKKEVNNSKKDNQSPTPIFSEIPSNSKFAELSKDIDIEDNFQKLSSINNININNNIIMNNKEKTNIISTSILNNAIPSNYDTNVNINYEKKNNEIDIKNNSEYNNYNNENNISIENNYNSESKNNITLSSINNDENKNISISMETIKDKNKNKKIQIKLSPLVKRDYELLIEEEKANNSNVESQKINLENVRNINCNTYKDNNSIEISDGYDDILYKEDISTSVDENSFLKKFDLFLSYNNIIIQNYLPLALNENSQKYLKKNIFWEKYINYIYLNYTFNNEKISLFGLIHIIEQYFLWCENLNQENISKFKKLIIETINAIFSLEEIKQFCSINRIHNLDDLFGKYEIMQKINKSNEVEIKINQEVECKCDLCKSEYACMKKLSEINQNLITEINTENLYLEANKENNKNLNSSGKKKVSYDGESKDQNNSFIFKKNKTLHSFVAAYEYIPEKQDKSSNKKRKSSLLRSEKKSISSDKKESKGTNEDKNSNKIEKYFSNEKEKNEKERNTNTNTKDDDTSNNDNKSKGKNKSKKGRKKSYKEEKTDGDSENEEEIKIQKKKKRKKSRKKEKEEKDNDNDDNNNKSDNETKIKNDKEAKKGKKYPKALSKKNK